jgi:hypothetical protein
LIEDHRFGCVVSGAGEAGGERREWILGDDFELSECKESEDQQSQAGADGSRPAAAFEFLDKFFGGFSEFGLCVCLANFKTNFFGVRVCSEAEPFEKSADGDSWFVPPPSLVAGKDRAIGVFRGCGGCRWSDFGLRLRIWDRFR